MTPPSCVDSRATPEPREEQHAAAVVAAHDLSGLRPPVGGRPPLGSGCRGTSTATPASAPPPTGGRVEVSPGLDRPGHTVGVLRSDILTALSPVLAPAQRQVRTVALTARAP